MVAAAGARALALWMLAALGAACSGDPAGTPERAAGARAGHDGGQPHPEFALRFHALYRQALGQLPVELPAATRFSRSPELGREITAGFVAGYRPVHGAGRADVMGLVASGEALDALRGQIREYGLDPDDVADVMAFHFAVHWAIANDEMVPGERLVDIREALYPRILDQAVGTGGADADIQRLADGLALSTVVRSMEYVALLRESGEPAAAAYRDAAWRDFIERTGTDLRRIEVTAAGLVERPSPAPPRQQPGGEP